MNREQRREGGCLLIFLVFRMYNSMQNRVYRTAPREKLIEEAYSNKGNIREYVRKMVVTYQYQE